MYFKILILSLIPLLSYAQTLPELPETKIIPRQTPVFSSSIEVPEITSFDMGEKKSQDETAMPIINPPKNDNAPSILPSPKVNAKCNFSGNINDLLSPSCMLLLGPQSGSSPLLSTSQPPLTPTNISCNVIIFYGEKNSNVSNFPSQTLKECLDVGTKMSYGIPGTSNIIVTTPQGVIAIHCIRKQEATSAINCRQQG